MVKLRTDSLPRPADTDQVRVGFEHWAESRARLDDTDLQAFAEAAETDPDMRATLEAVFGNSPYLSRLLIQDIPFAQTLLTEDLDNSFTQLISDVSQSLDKTSSTQSFMAGLRRLKRRAALLIALADITGSWPLETVTRTLSELADASLRLSVRHTLRTLVKNGDIDVDDPETPEVGSGLIILAMGKLGARELNYSSDIDLVILFDDGRVRSSKPDRIGHSFVRLAKELVRILEERTGDGYVFRTDLRLRPDPGATPLAVSVSAAEAYYGSLGQNWERAAMIKARPVAGDLDAGMDLLKLLQPWIWRRSLDFAAIQDIHSIKRQIGAHRGHKVVAVEGHNIKLGRGGIREIEFFAQTQQLIYGGRDPRLRTVDTVASLATLAEAGLITDRARDDLTASYGFLRRVEHRIQMVDDRQTHTLPRTAEGVATIARFLGYEDADEFRTELTGHLNQVEEHYAALFEDSPALSGPGNLVFTGGESDPDTLATLETMGYANPEAVAASVRSWHHGRYRATRSNQARQILTELVPSLLDAFAKTTSPDATFLRFDDFLSRLPAGVQLFSLFQSNPRLLGLVAQIMGTAPLLADHLSRYPQQLDSVLSQDFFDTLPDRDDLGAELERILSPARDYQDVLDIIRRWVHDKQFQAGLHILRDITDGEGCGPFIADVADTALAALQPRVEAEFARRHGEIPGGEMAILALGKLGSRQMSITSDLDLIMVYTVPEDATGSDGEKPLSVNEYYIRLAQRLFSAITAPTPEGRLFEVDMRLRPSGNAGPLAVSLATFEKYQTTEAWTWEHQALTRARVVTGGAQLRKALEATIHEVLAKSRDGEALRAEVATMRQRIDKEHGTTDVWDLKYVRGGFVDIEFIAQYLILRHAHDTPGIMVRDTRQALAIAAEHGQIDAEAGNTLMKTLSLWRRVNGFLRLTTSGTFDPASAPDAFKEAIVNAAMADDDPELDFEGLKTIIHEAARRAYEQFQAIIGDPPAADGTD